MSGSNTGPSYYASFIHDNIQVYYDSAGGITPSATIANVVTPTVIDTSSTGWTTTVTCPVYSNELVVTVTATYNSSFNIPARIAVAVIEWHEIALHSHYAP